MSGSISQFLTFCPGPGTTRDPTREESTWAELLILAYFQQDFGRRFGQPYLVVAQLDYLRTLTGRQTIDAVLNRMATNFRNELAKVPLRKDITSNRPGGNLKPDILGIALTIGGMVLELVEVTTFKQAGTTLIQDVGNKLQALREKVLNENTSTLEDDYYGRPPTGRTPFNVGPSKWRPHWDQMVCPLPRKQQDTTFEWICYWPTFRFNPSGAGGIGGVDGLILYEIHSVELPSMVPKEVLDRLLEEVRRKRAQGLTLTPWITDSYWQANKTDSQVLLALAGIGGIALLAILCAALWPVAAVGVGSAVAEGGLASVIAAAGTGAVTGEAVAAAATGVGGALRLSAQVMQSLGRPILYGAATQ